MAYLLPYHQYPFMAFYNDWIAILAVVIGFIFFAEERKTTFSIPSIAWLPLFLAALIILQIFLGRLSAVTDGWQAVAYLLATCLAIILGGTIAAQRNGTARLSLMLAVTFLSAGLVSIIIASMQFFGVENCLGSFAMQMAHDQSKAIRPYANIGQPNQLALLFCLSLAAVWWFYQGKNLRTDLAMLVTITLLWGLALTQSRIGWIIVPLFLAANWYWQKKAPLRPVSIWLAIGLAVCYAGLVIALPAIASFLGIVTSSAAERMGTSSERMGLFRQALEISLAHPWFGAGWYEFGPQQSNVAYLEKAIYSQHSHNVVLNFAAEMGWPITIGLVSVLGYWFVKIYFGRAISKETAFAGFCFIAVSVHSMVEFPLWYAYVLLPLAVMMGMVHCERFGAKTVAISRIWISSISLAIALSLVAVAADYRRLVLGFRALGWESLGLKADEGTIEKPEFTIFPHYYDYLRFAKSKAHENMSGEKIAFMEHVAKRFGYAPVLMRMSLIYALNGRSVDAEKMLLTMNKLHSKDYAEAYLLWKGLAETRPEIYAAIFRNLPPPN